MSAERNILIPDCDTGIAALVALSLKKEFKKIKIIGCFYKKNSITKYSIHIDDVILLTHRITFQKLKELIELKNVNLIFPVSIDGMEFCILNKSKIKEICNLIITPDIKYFYIANDKYKLFKLLKTIDVLTPDTELLSNIHEVKKTAIIKPRRGSGGSYIRIINGQNDLDLYKGIFDNHIYQEYINGYDIGCSVFCFEGNIRSYTIQKPLRRKNDFTPFYSALTFVMMKRYYCWCQKS